MKESYTNTVIIILELLLIPVSAYFDILILYFACLCLCFVIISIYSLVSRKLFFDGLEPFVIFFSMLFLPDLVYMATHPDDCHGKRAVMLEESAFKQKAVDDGFAHYDPVTGEVKWNDEK